jgi:cardiolipin synthase A/B
MQQRLVRWIFGGCFLLMLWRIGLAPSTQGGATLATPPRVTSLYMTETTTATHSLYLPLLQRPPIRTVIAAAHIDSVLTGEPDEAIFLWNLDGVERPLAGWRLRANGRTATFPVTSTITLPAAGGIWCTKTATSFQLSFGFTPACEWSESDPDVPNLTGSAPLLTNSGGLIQLIHPEGATADTLIYGNTTTTAPDWDGPAAQLYTRGAIPAGGQIWRRKFDAAHLPMDTDRGADWSGDLADLIWGRQVFFPGWSLWFSPQPPIWPPQVSAATTTVAIGPDGLYTPIAELIAAAVHTIDLSLYTFEHPELAVTLMDAAQRGVRVRLLIEGAPAGGIDNLQKWLLAQMVDAGVTVYSLATHANAPKGYRPRYRFSHAKYGIIDGSWLLIGTENFTHEAMPLPTDRGIPQGRRGIYLITDAPPAVATFTEIFAADWAPDRFADLRPFDPFLDGPPPDFAPEFLPVDAFIDAVFAEPLTISAQMRTAVVAAPDNALRPDAALMDLLARAGPGDRIHWLQLYEYKYWGETTSNPIADPNPRLQALIDAARRGASVRLLLDSFFDTRTNPRGNRATVDYLHTLAVAEHLDMQARVGNPTGLGVHAKASLFQIGDERWSAVGSLNGSEISHKLNREVVLLIENGEIHNRLVALFEHDWARSE